MDLSASNHINGTPLLFTSYDNKKHKAPKVSIRFGKHLLIVGSGNI